MRFLDCVRVNRLNMLVNAGNVRQVSENLNLGSLEIVSKINFTISGSLYVGQMHCKGTILK